MDALSRSPNDNIRRLSSMAPRQLSDEGGKAMISIVLEKIMNIIDPPMVRAFII